MVLKNSKLLRLFFGSILLVFVSIFLMMVYNTNVSQAIIYDDEFSKPFSPPKVGEIISYEKMMANHREAERIGKIREARDREIEKNKSTYESWKEMKQYALPVVWIPWLIFPLFLQLNRKKFLIVISAPVIMVFTGAVMWFEIPFYLVAMLIGVWLKRELN